MPRTVLSAAALALVLLAGGCGDEEPSPPPASGAEEPSAPPASGAEPESACLVTADELTEMTGTEQTVEQSDAPGAQLYCATSPDARGVEMEWFLKEPTERPAPGPQAQRRSLEASGMDVSEVDLGTERPGWLGQGPLDLPRAQVVTVLGGGELFVNVLDGATDDGSDDLAQDATDLASALVAAHEASQ